MLTVRKTFRKDTKELQMTDQSTDRPLLMLADAIVTAKTDRHCTGTIFVSLEEAEVLRAADAVIEQLEYAVAYDNEHDEVGYRVCCQVTSYKDHSESCPMLAYQRAVEAWRIGR